MKHLLLILISITTMVSCHSGKVGKSDPEINIPEDYVQGELLVIFKHKNTYKNTITELENNEGVQLKEMIMVAPPDAIIGHFNVPIGKEKEFMAIFQNHKGVKHAELNAYGSFIDSPTSNVNFIKGKVESIEYGKDGYTAKIKTLDNNIYFATISIPNLGRANAHQYRDVKVGETIEVQGEEWSMGEEKRITVRVMKPAENILIVASKTVNCEGVAEQQCLLVKKAGAKDWEYFYDSIQGFDYEPGYEYELEINEIMLENPPADGSSIKTILVNQRSKTRKTSEY